MKSIYIPNNLDEAKEIATLLEPQKARDLLQCHAAFGHHFNFDMGLVQTQSFCLRGKASLTADAMAGICRNSGLVRFMRIATWDVQHCKMEFARNDEPADIVHTFVYTYEMAQAQGLTNNRNWKQMPLQMLRSRVLTMGLRAIFPDAVSGIYSADEIADNTNMSDDERAMISAESLGEEIGNMPTRQAKARPKQEQPKQEQPKQEQPKQEPPKQKKTEVKVSNPVWSFNDEVEFWAVIDEHGIPKEEAQNRLNKQKIDPADCSAEELEDAFYSFIKHHVVRRAWASLDNWWKSDNEQMIEGVHNGFVAQYPALAEVPPNVYGPRMNEPAYAEFVQELNRCPEEFEYEARKMLTYMKKNDWSKVNEYFTLLDS